MTRGTLVAMESSSQSARSSLPVDRVVLALLVWAGSVWLSAPGLTWLDSSELAAAGVTLGVPHAPGHPLYIVLAHLASLVPIGSAAFRVALLSGAFAAAAAWMTADLVEELAWDQATAALRLAGAEPDRSETPIELATRLRGFPVAVGPIAQLAEAVTTLRYARPEDPVRHVRDAERSAAMIVSVCRDGLSTRRRWAAALDPRTISSG